MESDAPLFSLPYGRYFSYSKFQSKFKGLIASYHLIQICTVHTHFDGRGGGGGLLHSSRDQF